MVLTVMIPVRRIFGLEEYITDYHFENMSRFILLHESIIVGYAYGISEYFIAWYSGVEFEQTSFWLRAFGPVLVIHLDHDHLQRRRPTAAVVQEAAHQRAVPLSCCRCFINIGMWFERYVIIITGLSREYDPRGLGRLHAELPVELVIVAGSFGWFFAHVLPASS